MAEKELILLVDDDATSTSLMKDLLDKEGFAVQSAGGYEEAVTALEKRNYRVLITDLKMPGKSGMELLEYSRAQYPEIPVIMLTGHGSIQNAVEALKKGAFDYLSKPIRIDELLIDIQKAIAHEQILQQNTFLREELNRKKSFLYETANDELRQIYRTVESIREINSTVLIQGESGTGKEVLARYIHNTSSRAKGSFVPINCGAIPESLIESELFGYEKGAFTDAKVRTKGKLEIAHGGTLFLDEINELPVKAQVALLRFIQEREIVPLGSSRRISLNVRIIAATNKNLRKLMEAEQFRHDLYYRINVLPLKLPPLRDRREDILPLAEWFLELFRSMYGKPKQYFNPQAVEALQAYSWPGNIRELRNCVERASIITMGDEITAESLFLTPAEGTSFESKDQNRENCFEELGIMPLKTLNERYIEWVLEKNGGNKTRTSEDLRISLRGLRYKLNNEED